ncbi:multicopper oxidase domain-containing protein [Nitrosospira sp. Nsp13]
MYRVLVLHCHILGHEDQGMMYEYPNYSEGRVI